MASPASAERIAVVAATLGATTLGWLGLSALAGAMAPLCGLSAEGLGSLAALVAMWSLMVTTMMLPVTLVLAAGQSARDGAAFALGYVMVALLPAWGAALAEWTLRTMGALPATLPSAGAQIVLVGIAALGIVRDVGTHRGVEPGGLYAGFAAGRAHLGACIAMVALQLAFGSMDVLLMVALALWMLAAALIPGRVRHA